MGIAKMSRMTIEGGLDNLESALMACCDSGSFQMIQNTALHGISDPNPYSGIYTKVRDMAVHLRVKPEKCDFAHLPYETAEDFEQYFKDISLKYHELNNKYERIKRSLEEHKSTEAYVKHLQGLNVTFGDLFAMKFVEVRIGRMPVENVEKLQYYMEKCFVFIPIEQDAEYVYAIYLAPSSLAQFADVVMNSLLFERLSIPEYLTDKAQDSEKQLTEQIAAEEQEKVAVESELTYFLDSLNAEFQAVLCKLKYKSDCFELRHYAIAADGRFSFSGYCPSKECTKLRKAMKAISTDIKSVEVPVDRKTASDDVPVRLSNNRFVRPFEMFVKMYGLPSYRGFDPTPYVAWTYMILFGLMFGDVGQGLVVSLLGLLLTKLTKNGLAPIMTRLGIFSMAGGVIYGSVFGIETIITPFFHREEIWHGVCRLFKNLGIPEHPENIFQAATVILLFALSVGIVLILISMCFNMVQNFKEKKLGAALFTVNGLAGIVFYLALVVGVVGQLLFSIPMFSALYIILLIVLPLLAIFFKEPLSDLVDGKPVHKIESVGNFIIENFIEIFESAISFLSNTMSYLRVGGFVLSHAGFMLVVAQLAGTTDPNAEITVSTVIAYVIGNIVVMAIEGLLVGIQVLRLEFYEVFSRFYDGNGKPFTPVEIRIEKEN